MSDRRRKSLLGAWHSLSLVRFRHAVLIAAAIAPVWCVVHAAEIDGVQLPGTLEVDGKTLQLNGIGLRTYSILGIHIYVVGLYLEHLNTDAEAVLRSSETKLLTIKFEHNVSATAARDAWRKGLQKNCVAPCQLDPADLARFLAGVPAMHAGESYSILFNGKGAQVTADGAEVGKICRPQFAAAMLATFLGRAPASPMLKAELLEGHQ
jgi:hypothetical protein